MKKILFGNHLFCPECRSFDVICYETRFRCRKCRLKFSLVSHTWLSDINIPLQRFWLVLWCWTTQVPVQQTEKLTALSEKAVRHWFDLFRNHLPEHQETLERIVQLDEVYFGAFGKIALLMGKQAGSRKLAYVIKTSDAPGKIDAVNFLKRYVKPKTKLNTDASAIYRNIEKLFFQFSTPSIFIKSLNLPILQRLKGNVWSTTYFH